MNPPTISSISSRYAEEGEVYGDCSWRDMKNVQHNKLWNVQKRNTNPNFLTQISKELSQQIWRNIPGQVLGNSEVRWGRKELQDRWRWREKEKEKRETTVAITESKDSHTRESLP